MESNVPFFLHCIIQTQTDLTTKLTDKNETLADLRRYLRRSTLGARFRIA